MTEKIAKLREAQQDAILDLYMVLMVRSAVYDRMYVIVTIKQWRNADINTSYLYV